MDIILAAVIIAAYFAVHDIGALIITIPGIFTNILLINQNIHMAKRATGVGKGKRSHSHKTNKRLEIKRLMLEEKAKKHKKR